MANAAIVPAGSNAEIGVFVTNLSHVIIDTNGYFGQQPDLGWRESEHDFQDALTKYSTSAI